MNWLSKSWISAPRLGKAGMLGCGGLTLLTWVCLVCAFIGSFVAPSSNRTPAASLNSGAPAAIEVAVQATTPAPATAPANTPAPTDNALPPVQPTAPPPTAQPTDLPTATPTKSDLVLGTASDNLNIRKGPGTAYGSVGQLKQGERITIKGRNLNSSWVQFSRGWVSAAYLTLEGEVDRVPVVLVDPPPTLASTRPPMSTPTPVPLVVLPSPISNAIAPPPPSGCCKICTTGKACGNSCISRSYTCHKGPGCACNAP